MEPLPTLGRDSGTWQLLPKFCWQRPVCMKPSLVLFDLFKISGVSMSGGSKTSYIVTNATDLIKNDLTLCEIS
jgi:hypothetical protein